MKMLLTCTDPMTESEVGGKFARQATMAAEGLSVPPFFVVPAAFYRRVTAPLQQRVDARLGEVDFSSPTSVAAAAEEIGAWFAALPLAPADEQRILAQVAALVPENGLVSVRGSVIGRTAAESEDSADNPFAGMSKSFLYVRRDQVLARMREVWASAYGQELLAYRTALGLDHVGAAVAVGVQRMVFGERSFVLFTCDPNTAARDTLIVAGHGIGEGVVQEKVSVDHVFVRFNDGEIRQVPGHKRDMLTFDVAAGSGLRRVDVPHALRDTPCLSDDEVTALVQTGRSIETLFGRPQDIEGTMTADGAVHILQARPIAIDYRRHRVWTNANVTESFPGTSCALTYTFARYFYREIFRDCYRRLGVPTSQLHASFPWLDKMIGYLHGRIYYNLTAFYRLHSQSPLFPLFRASWEKMMGFLSSYEAVERGGGARVIAKARQRAAQGRATVNIAANFVMHEREHAAFLAWWSELAVGLRGRDFASKDPLEVMGEFHRVWREVGERWGITLLNDTYLPVIYGVVESLFKSWGLAHRQGLLSDLLCGDENPVSTEIVLSAVALAERARRDPRLSAVLQAKSGRDVWSAIERGEFGPEFLRAVREHLHDYGDRGLAELKMEQPSLRTTPWRLIEMIAAYVRTDVTTDSLREAEREVRRQAEACLAEELDGRPARRALLGRLLPILRRLIRNRENSRYCRSELFGFSRSVFMALGHHLANAGVLRSADDVVHLTMDEVFGWFDGTGVTENLQAIADLRRRELVQHETATLPVQVSTLGAVRQCLRTQAPASSVEGGELRGLGSSAGRVRGTARVIIDPNQPIAAGDNFILVARETDPGWLFLMLASRGLVVERGSLLSHTAITGRKLGIPTVVGVADATTRIPDGALIEIDGASGTVTILSSESTYAHHAA